MGSLAISSCVIHLPTKPTSIGLNNPVQSEFTLAKGTSWTYSDSEYQPAPSDPTQVITAQYQLTETVTEISSVNGLFIAHVQREQKPIQVPVDWMPSPPPGEFWYVIKGQQVFKSNAPVNLAIADTDTLQLAFDFPLSVNQSWCPVRVDLKDPSRTPITNCDNAGKQTVLKQSAYQVPAGKFDNCFQIDQASNGGDVVQWFCRDIGVVEVKFDHSGSRFGFKQELIGYNKSSRK
jgi:hypothetical protein